MNKELNDKMAEVMGWNHIHKNGIDSRHVWIKDGYHIMSNVYVWNPTEDMNQASRCAEKLLESPEYVQFSTKTWLSDNKILHSAYLHNADGKWIGGYIKETMSLAICEAIQEAVKE